MAMDTLRSTLEYAFGSTRATARWPSPSPLSVAAMAPSSSGDGGLPRQTRLQVVQDRCRLTAGLQKEPSANQRRSRSRHAAPQ